LRASPIVLLDVADFYAGLTAGLASLASQRFRRTGGRSLVQVARSLDEALDEVERFV
jgi:predicted Rossmann-fold nucleotide-binding protein